MTSMVAFSVRCTVDEKARLEAEARAAGVSVGEHVRRALSLRDDAPSLAGLQEDVAVLKRQVEQLRELAGI